MPPAPKDRLGGTHVGAVRTSMPPLPPYNPEEDALLVGAQWSAESLDRVGAGVRTPGNDLYYYNLQTGWTKPHRSFFLPCIGALPFLLPQWGFWVLCPGSIVREPAAARHGKTPLGFMFFGSFCPWGSPSPRPGPRRLRTPGRAGSPKKTNRKRSKIVPNPTCSRPDCAPRLPKPTHNTARAGAPHARIFAAKAAMAEKF